jgi:hypothetical protein
MKPENKKFLDDNRHFVDSYKMKDPPLKMNAREKQTLFNIVRDEFDSKIKTDLWCGPCFQAFIINAYIFYDQYLNKI